MYLYRPVSNLIETTNEPEQIATTKDGETICMREIWDTGEFVLGTMALRAFLIVLIYFVAENSELFRIIVMDVLMLPSLAPNSPCRNPVVEAPLDVKMRAGRNTGILPAPSLSCPHPELLLYPKKGVVKLARIHGIILGTVKEHTFEIVADTIQTIVDIHGVRIG